MLFLITKARVQIERNITRLAQHKSSLSFEMRCDGRNCWFARFNRRKAEEEKKRLSMKADQRLTTYP